jgi:hypothetical protein
MKKIILTAISLLTVTGQSFTMQPIASRAAIQVVKPFVKKGFSGTMTGLHGLLRLAFLYCLEQ